MLFSLQENKTNPPSLQLLGSRLMYLVTYINIHLVKGRQRSLAYFCTRTATAHDFHNQSDLIKFRFLKWSHK